MSVVIPTYNERENVLEVVERTLSALDGHEAEAIVVDDDSADGTWRLAREHYAGDDRVRVIRRVDGRGLATAVQRGFREADNEVCVVIDADLQHPPEKLPDLLASFEDPRVDVAIGSRHVGDGRIENWSRFRRLVSRGADALARLGVPSARSFSDPLSGFFAVRREVIADVELTPSGYKILLEVLAKGDYERVVEVPYVFRDRRRGTSKLTASQYLEFLVHVLQLRLGAGAGDVNDGGEPADAGERHTFRTSGSRAD